MQVQHHRQAQPPFIRANVSNIGPPNLICLVLLELVLQLFRRYLRGPAHLVPWPFVASHRLDLSHPHEPGHPDLSTLNSCLPQITNDSGAAVDTHTLLIELFDLRCQGLVLHNPCRQGLQQPGLEATALNVQHPAHPAQSELCPVLLDKHVLHSDCLAKYAPAFFRMSRSSVVRLSSAINRLSFACIDFMSSMATGSLATLNFLAQVLSRPSSIPSLLAASITEWPLCR
jgi:hypothetical protein